VSANTQAVAVNDPAGPRPRRISRSKAGARGPWLGVVPFSLYVLIFLGVPLYMVIHGALTTDAGHLTWANFHDTLASGTYRAAFKTSILLSLWTALLGAVFGTWLAAAIVVAPAESTLRRLITSAASVFAYFAGLPLAFTFIAALGRFGVVTDLFNDIGFHLYAHGFSITSMFGVGLVYVYFQVPLMVILVLPALEGLQPQWRQAAESLGATRWAYMRHIAIPVLTPALLGSTLLLFGNAFAAYATALALVGSTINLVPAQIDSAINGNVQVNADRLGLALGVEMIVVIVVVMIVYWIVQHRARRWLA